VGPGPLEKEITDQARLTVHHTKGREVGSVSGRLRRIGDFEDRSAFRTISINSATKLAITHIDIFKGNGEAKKISAFTREAKTFLKKIESLSKIYPYPSLALVSYGPGLMDVIDLRASEGHRP